MLRKDGKKISLVRACGAWYIQGENNHVRSSVTPVECWWQCFTWLLSVIYQCWEPIHTLLPQLQLLTHQQADVGCVSLACSFNCKSSTANLPSQSTLNRAGLGMRVSLGQDVVGLLGWPSCADLHLVPGLLLSTSSAGKSHVTSILLPQPLKQIF